MTKEQRELVNAAKQIHLAWKRLSVSTSNMTKCINRLAFATYAADEADKKDKK